MMMQDDQYSKIEGPARGLERMKKIIDNPSPWTAEEVNKNHASLKQELAVLQSNQGRGERIKKKTRNNKQWTEEEDEKLKVAVQSIQGTKRWEKIAECVGNRTSLQCEGRWCMNLRPWSKEEDEKLTYWANKNGKNWWAISQSLSSPGRSGKQCEDRWLAIKDMNLTSTFCPEAQQSSVDEGAMQQAFEWSLDIANMPHSFTSQVKVGIMEINKASDISCDGLQSSPTCLERKRKMRPYSTKQWTREEDEKLKVAEQSIEGIDKWEKIAECLGDRTSSQCHTRWNFVRHFSLKEKMDMNLASGGFVPQFECLSLSVVCCSEEAEQNCVDDGAMQPAFVWSTDVPHSFTSQLKVGVTEPNKASNVACDGQRRPPCIKRRKMGSLKKPYNYEPWTEEEDEKLKVAVQSIEGRGRWEKIAECVGNRTPLQCEGRWVMHRRYVLKGPWSKKEDEKLTKLVKKKGTNWWAISKFLPDRSRKRCEDRWLAIKDKKLASVFCPEAQAKQCG